jgi:hypothetical protein
VTYLKDYLKAGKMRVKSGTDSSRGQSLVELALIMPILITLLLGMVEVVNIGRTYLALLDSSYQGAHLGSQGNKRYDNCKIFTLVSQDLAKKGLDNSSLIDVIITRYDLSGGKVVSLTVLPTLPTPPCPSYNSNPAHMKSPGRASKLTSALLVSRLQSSDPNGKLVAVEIVYDYTLLFPWPNFAGILPNPFPLGAYTIQYSPRQ